VVYLSSREPYGFQEPDDENSEARELRSPERLDEYILRQIGPALTLVERPVAAYILNQLDENGFLLEAPAEIAAYQRVPLATVARVLTLIQHADPPGVGARTPAECLIVQLECLADSAPSSMLNLARAIIQDHFELLAKREYQRIAHRLRVPRSAVEGAALFIQRNLSPKPTQPFWGDGKTGGDSGPALINPDVMISLFDRQPDGPLLVEVFTPLAGWLRVNPELKAALAECSEEEREKWSAAIDRASLIAKCVQQRNHTMRRLMEVIAREQRGFILGGDGDLRPLTRARVSQELRVHESTISRAVAGKFTALPNGRIVPLSKFFDRSLSVRDRVRNIVEAEARPLTDDEIADALEREGLQVARRTVAKYRHMLGILPANVRARLKLCPRLSSAKTLSVSETLSV
jgi:RNA polymerase sigma-54 factor